MEETLARFWCDILGVDSVEPTDDFFDLGGNSLAVLMLLTAINEECGLEVELEELFIATTLHQQVEVVETARLNSLSAT